MTALSLLEVIGLLPTYISIKLSFLSAIAYSAQSDMHTHVCAGRADRAAQRESSSRFPSKERAILDEMSRVSGLVSECVRC